MYYNNELYHHGVLGMKWGVRKAPKKLSAGNATSSTTKKAIKDYNRMDDRTFKETYSVSKNKYAKRVAKYGDPYMNSPLAKVGKKLERKQTEKSINKAERKANENKNDNLKKAVKIGAAVAGTAVAAYGTYKLAKFVRNENVNIAIRNGKKAMNEYIKSNAKSEISSFTHTPYPDRNRILWIRSHNTEVAKKAGQIMRDNINSAKKESLYTASKNVAKSYIKKDNMSTPEKVINIRRYSKMVW